MTHEKFTELFELAGAVMTEKLEWGLRYGRGALTVAEGKLAQKLREHGWEPPVLTRCACGRAEELCPGCGKPWCPACCAPCGTGLRDEGGPDAG